MEDEEAIKLILKRMEEKSRPDYQLKVMREARRQQQALTMMFGRPVGGFKSTKEVANGST